MQQQLEKLKKEMLEGLKEIKDSEALKDLEIKYLGRKGELTRVLRGIADLAVDEKKKIGFLANEVKNELQTKLKEVREIIDGQEVSGDFVDVTLPGKRPEYGHLSPMTQTQNELEDMFLGLGFMILDGPELESDFYNFEGLNIPASHPARDMQDTFYIDKKNKDKEYDMVMRTHTSPVQVRAMQKYGAPLRAIALGRVFRCEALDAVHEHTFNQIEGLMIGENISLANLIAVLKEMLTGILKQEITLRVRPGYFPFVEPGLEVDVKCTICGGRGCPSCKHSGWLETLGAGMVHPNVLRHGKIDPNKYTGFAFGMGLERLIMMKYGIDDIRSFNSGDLRFLQQF